nr:hypothetical protein [Haloprofundus marisrubri]
MSADDREELQRRLRTASEMATELYEIERRTDGTVVAFSNLKVLIHGRKIE